MGELSGPKEIDLSGIRLVISDWDGTLVDSMLAYTQCFLKVMEELGGEPDELRKYYLSSAGTALATQIRDAAKQFAGREIEDTRYLEAKFFDYYLEMGDIRVLEGVPETLRYLKENGFKIAVWSSTRTDILGKKLEQTGLDQFVDFYVGAVPGDTQKVKGPYLFAEIAKHFQVPIETLQQEAVVIGDGIGDIEAGINSGAKTIGLGAQREKLAEAGADFVTRDISELPKLIGS